MYQNYDLPEAGFNATFNSSNSIKPNENATTSNNLFEDIVSFAESAVNPN